MSQNLSEAFIEVWDSGVVGMGYRGSAKIYSVEILLI